MDSRNVNRRSFLTGSVSTLGVLSLGNSLSGVTSSSPWLSYKSLKDIGPLQKPDAHGISLPKGFRSQVLVESGQSIQKGNGTPTSYKWHKYPDGGACFPTQDGGWIYTSNAEVSAHKGGAGALRFSSKGDLIDAYPILTNTNRNCAGGPTPWGTWLSCEEARDGRVYQCDIYGKGAQICQGLGTFTHEAVCIDPKKHQAYLTEDEPDGCLYRYTPKNVTNKVMDLDQGLLEVAQVNQRGLVSWLPLKSANPKLNEVGTRYQHKGAATFNGAEGIWYHEGDVFFVTKGDNRLWKLHLESSKLSVVYDRKTSPTPILSGVDNITVSPDGMVLVAEDGGDMQVVAVGPYGEVFPLLQIHGQDHSEITGLAIAPKRDRMYFSSQRGGASKLGITYEIIGRFPSA